jgi:hypothetical protein
MNFSKKLQFFTHINQAIHILFSLILNPLLNAINIKFIIICVKVKIPFIVVTYLFIYITQIYGPIFFFKVDRERIQPFSKEGSNRGTQTQIFRRF